jgi:DNA-binding NarL/FixJ family response regulator
MGTNMNPYSIFLVEDHAGFANALNNMLSQNQNLKIVAVAETAEEALEQLRGLNVDLVLIDFSLPDMTGLNLLERLHHERPDLRCAILSGHVLPQHARRALDVGGRGYLIKDNPLEILEGIQCMLQGDYYISEELRNTGPTDLLTGLV